MRYLAHATAPLLCLLCCSLAGEVRERSFNARISSRSIAMNQTVRVEFLTTKPDIEGLDIANLVRSAFEVPKVRKTWRLVEEPHVALGQKIKSVEVAFTLLPREPGTHNLPKIPIRWLSGDQMAVFGEVSVLDHLVIGDETRPLPKETSSVGGVPWTASEAQLKAQTSASAISEGEGGIRYYEPKKGLRLKAINGTLAEARLMAPGTGLAQASFALIDRWGEPIFNRLDQTPPALTWVIGWVRICVSEVPEGLHVTVTREDQESKAIESHLDDHIFDLLDSADDTDRQEDPQNKEPDAQSAVDKLLKSKR